MGKKLQGAALRAKKRAKAAQLELVEETAHNVAITSHVTSKTNNALFVLDTTATQVPKEQQPKSKKSHTSKKPRVVDSKVQALLSKHDAATLQKMAATKPNKKRKATPAFDLWQDDNNKESTATVKRAAGVAPPHLQTKAARAAAGPKKPSIAVDVAQSGQSYHPDPHQHQNVIGEALALELRRQEEEDYRKDPLATGMREETKAILMGDESDDESSSDEEDETTPVVLHKAKEKLTRAQRNRQKRIRAQEKQLQQQKLEKKRLNAISQAKVVAKQLRKQESLQQERKAHLQSLKQQQTRVLGKSVVQSISERNPLHAPTLPVALTDEISGALRTMKPKGSLLTDRMESFRDRNMATSKRVGDRKHIVQGNKRRKLKVKAKGHSDIHVRDEETGKDYLLMG